MKYVVSVSREGNKIIGASIASAKETVKVIKKILDLFDEDEREEFKKFFDTSSVDSLVRSYNALKDSEIFKDLKEEFPEMAELLNKYDTTYFVVSEKKLNKLLDLLS